MCILKKIARWHSDLQTFDKITSYPYDASLGKVCQTELPEYLNTKCLVLVITQMKT